jgi:hypothetical protein
MTYINQIFHASYKYYYIKILVKLLVAAKIVIIYYGLIKKIMLIYK